MAESILAGCLSAVTEARAACQRGEFSFAVTHYEGVLGQLRRAAKLTTLDGRTLGTIRDAINRIGSELAVCREVVSHLDEARGASAPVGPRSGHVAMWDPSNQEPCDDGNMQPSVSQGAVGDSADRDVWRPPTRDGPPGPVRVQQGRPVAPIKARISVEEHKAPQWARNPGNQVQAAAGPAGRAVSAQRQQPAVVRGNAAGNARGGQAAKADPDRPWRNNMGGQAAGGGKQAAGGGAGQGAGGPEERKINYVGPDADLAVMLEREMLVRSPNIPFSAVAGLHEAKRVLDEAAILPLEIPEYFTGIRKPFKGVMLFGPPGTGKTMLAKAVATEAGCSFFNVSSATLASKYRGESERMVRCLFDLARCVGPSIIFIDEVDSLCSQRGAQGEHEASRRVKTELLTQVDGCHNDAPPEPGPNGEQAASKRVMVLAATNFPWDIDEAMRRRLEKRIYIPLPGPDDRLALLKLALDKVVLADDVNLENIAQRLEGYSGDDITNICRDAALAGIRRPGRTPAELRELKRQGKDLANEPISQEDLQSAIARINPSVAATDIAKYEAWKAEFGSA